MGTLRGSPNPPVLAPRGEATLRSGSGYRALSRTRGALSTVDSTWFGLARRLTLRSNAPLGGRMNRKVLGLASFVVSAALVGCGGGGPNYPDARVDLDATPDTTTKVDTGTDAPAPPMSAATSKLLVPGGAVLIGSGPE